MSQFLFQTGSIKRRQRALRAIAHAKRFLFQTGSIKRNLSLHSLSNMTLGFYSKLVRLKGKRSVADGTSFRLRFYSKLVRLKVGSAGGQNGGSCSFLFQTGSIKRPPRPLPHSDHFHVSIPNWFD